MKKCFFAFILFTLALWNLAAQVSDASGGGLNRYALFIGSNKGGEGRQELVYAVKDAASMSRVLGEIGGIPRRNNILLKDPDGNVIDESFHTIKDTLETNGINGRVEFILYYSGHSDETGILLGEERYTYKKLRDNIQSIKADVHIAILDSCYSGAFTRLKGGVRRTPFLVDESVDTKGYAFLTSSSENEAAQESDAIEGSFFTHYLLSALRGAADATSQDKKITLNEAYSYASGETLARTENTLAGPQHAMYDMNLTGSGDIVLTDLRTTDAAVELKRDLEGRLFIRDSRGNLVSEIKKLQGVPMSLALPPGYYSATLQDRSGILETDIILRRGKNTVIALRDFDSVNPEVTRVRGDSPSGTYVENNTEEQAATAAESEDLPEELEEVKQDALKAIEVLQNRLHKKDPQEESDSVSDEVSDNRRIPDPPAESTGSSDDIELVHVYNSFGIIPKMNMNQGIVAHNLSIHLIGSVYRVQGISLGLINLVDEDVRGVQIGSIMSLTGGNLTGFQGSGIFNLTDGNQRGGQTAGVFNLTGGNVGFLQSAGVFNITGGDVNGLQSAGVFNITEGNLNGIQAAGVFNIAEETANALQAAAVFNMAGDFRGLQASALFNSADTVNGLQVSTVNVSGKTNGVQIGVVNIAKEMNGLAIGLINISSNGLHHASSWVDEQEYFYTGYQLGSKPLYTLVYAGFPYESTERPFVSGLGMGVHLERSNLFLDLDITAKNVAGGTNAGNKAGQMFSYSETSVFPYVRATAGIMLGKRIALIGGIGADIHMPGVTTKSPLFHEGDNFEEFDYSSKMESAQLYPKYFIGLRF